jgi:hypothetical protein
MNLLITFIPKYKNRIKNKKKQFVFLLTKYYKCRVFCPDVRRNTAFAEELRIKTLWTIFLTSAAKQLSTNTRGKERPKKKQQQQPLTCLWRDSEQGENKMKAFISQRREWNAVEIRHAKWAE